MPVPTLISELSQTANSNSPSGTESPITTDNYLRAHAAFIAELRDAVDAEEALSAINFNPGNATAVAGSAMQIDALMEAGTPTYPLEDEAAIWTGKAITFAGISKEFTSSDGSANGPLAGLFVFINNNNSPGDAVAIIADAVARTSGDRVYGANFIARSAAGITAPVLVGLEIDITPSAGVTPGAGSGGLFINVFSEACSGGAIQIGGVGGGTFSSGIAITGGMATSAAGLFSNGITMDSLINTGSSTYNSGAILLTNTHRVVFKGTGASPASMYNDASNFFRILGGTAGTVIRNQADTASLLSVADSGIVTLSSSSTINWDAALTGSTVGAAGGASALPATPLGYITVQRAGVNIKIPYYNT